MSITLQKDKRFQSITAAIAAIKSFAEETQHRRIQFSQEQSQIEYQTRDSLCAVKKQKISQACSANALIVQCTNAPQCKWFVRLLYVKNGKQWKISSLYVLHHPVHCLDDTFPAPSSDNKLHDMSSSHPPDRNLKDITHAQQPKIEIEYSYRDALDVGNAIDYGVSAPHELESDDFAKKSIFSEPLAPHTASNMEPSLLLDPSAEHMFVGMIFANWKSAITSVRALARQVGRRVVSERIKTMFNQDKKPAFVRRVLCQNHRNSNCYWMVQLQMLTMDSDISVDSLIQLPEPYKVLSIHLLHSKECLETNNFSNRNLKVALPKQMHIADAAEAKPLIGIGDQNCVFETTKNEAGGNAATQQHNAHSNSVSFKPEVKRSLLADDYKKYQLSHDKRWSSGKEASKAVSDFALIVQKKRAKLCKKNNGGSNKKYICSDENCLWFVQLVRGWKSKTWKISALNLKHSTSCTGQPKPTARQLSEMNFFRQAVIAHMKSNGKLLTDQLLTQTKTGIYIPRGMAYRAQRMVVANSPDDLTESYKFIPSLFDYISKKNEGSIVLYEKDQSNCFIRGFCMPNATIFGLHCMQKIFGIHILHYDNVNFTGCVILLIGRNGNFQSTILAFALSPSSKSEHIIWFIQLVKKSGLQFKNTPIVCSLIEHGVLQALAVEAPTAHILFCMNSMISNMNQTMGNAQDLESLVFQLQAKETREGFQNALTELESLNASGGRYLQSIPPEKWAHYANRSIRLYQWSTTFADEALQNSGIQESDEAPFDLIYSLLAFLMDAVYRASQLANRLSAENPLLTPGSDEFYRQELREAEQFTVRVCDDKVAFTWRAGARPKVTYRIQLADQMCTCGQMYQVGIPCRHFIAVAMHYASEGILMDAFDRIYLAATFSQAYRNRRIEIPAANDLSKDPNILPMQSSKSIKQKKKARAHENAVSDAIRNGSSPSQSLKVNDDTNVAQES